MDSNSEEPEIKIEYEDDGEDDPLYLTKYYINKQGAEISDSCQAIDEKESSWFERIDDYGRYLCRFCTHSYSSVETIKGHMKTKHFDEALAIKNTLSNKKSNRRLMCHICKVRFKVLQDLEHHLRLSHQIQKEKRFCQMCQLTFDNEFILSEHLQAKHGVSLSKMHFCNTCGYMTKKLSHFKQHKNTHLNMKTEKCSYCNYETSYRPNLKIHEQLHKDIKPYSCDYMACTYSAKSRAGLRNHKLKHNKESHYMYCDKCTYKTVYQNLLKRHLDSHARNTIRALLNPYHHKHI